MSSQRAEQPVQAQAGQWWCLRCERRVPAAEARVMRSGRLRCAECGRRLVSAEELADYQAEEAQDEDRRAPWHFKLLAVGTVGYLVYRLIWVIFWLTGHAWHG